MKSELWQRLRAARDCADLKQLDIAKACGVSRAAVALWESKIENNRSTPSIEHVQSIARETKVPMEWLLNDSADPSDVWKVRGMSAPGTSKAAAVPDNLFEKAVQFEITQRAPDLLQGFGKSVSIIGHRESVSCDFYFGDVIAQMATHFAMEKVAQLLLAETAAGRPMTKALLIYNTGKGSPVENPEMLGVRLIPVRTAAEAADALIALTK